MQSIHYIDSKWLDLNIINDLINTDDTNNKKINSFFT